MRYIFYFLIFFILTCFSFNTKAALKGFNEGPFLYLTFGAMQTDFDKDQYANADVGNPFEPSFGFIFGWNIKDDFSVELSGRYATDINDGKREHIIGSDIHGRYFFIFDNLTKSDTIKILPVLKTGLAFRVASLPGNANTTDSAVTNFGWGPSFGIGVNFRITKYISLGIDAQEDLLFFDDVRQDLTVNNISLPNTLIYKGGFKPQFTALFYFGVHY